MAPSRSKSPPAGRANPQQVLQRAMALHQGGRLDEARTLYEQILAAHPGHPEILALLGTLALQAGRPQEALGFLDRALAAEPAHVAALSNRAHALRTLRRPQEALEACDRAIAIRPDHPDPHANRGSALAELGRWAEAAESFAKALGLRPGPAEAWSNYGNALRQLGRFDECLAAFDRALALDPRHGGARSNRGNALLALGRAEEALAEYDRAIALRPGFAEAHTNRGNALLQLRRWEEALESHDRAIALRPDFAEAHANRADALGELRRRGEALASAERAIALRPGFAEAYNTRGNALRDLGRWAEAEAAFDEAIALDPGYAEPRWNKALALLQQGRFAEGWPLYEWRRRKRQPIAARAFAEPPFTGAEEIRGRTVFLWAEQGLGDTLQVFRYALELRDRGATVVAAVQDPLVPLLRQFEPGIRVTGAAEVPDRFDLQCPMMSLPMALGATVGNIPHAGGWLAPPPGLREAWDRRLGMTGRPRIGLAWSGSPRYRYDRWRSMPLDRLAPLLALDADWVCLQDDIREADREAARRHPGLRLLPGEIGDLPATAGLMAALDLVVSVDTGLAHLAGALGRPVWVMLAEPHDWRWLTGREDTPWYAQGRLFRQPAPGDWDSVAAAVGVALRARFPALRPG